MSQNVIIAGGAGFIGSALIERLIKRGFTPIILTREPDNLDKTIPGKLEYVLWDGKSSKKWKKYVRNSFAIINLAGENISRGRWTDEKKKLIVESRINAGKAICEAVQDCSLPPKVIIQASAVGYYGSRRNEKLDESSHAGKGFLADVCKKWEASILSVEKTGIRTVVIRSAVVLGHTGGALPKIVNTFKHLFGAVPSGSQWFSWIHIEDEMEAIIFLMKNKNAHGVFNLSSPEPIKMTDFCHELSHRLHKPLWGKIPSFLVKAAFGEMANETILTSQRVFPHRLIELEFKFKYPTAKLALENILPKL